MDQELKQRLIGAAVITALAAIFVPMLFDDPIDETGKEINALTIPEVPEKVQDVEIMPLPEKVEDVAAVEPAEKPLKTGPAVVEEGAAETNVEAPRPQVRLSAKDTAVVPNKRLPALEPDEGAVQADADATIAEAEDVPPVVKPAKLPVAPVQAPPQVSAAPKVLKPAVKAPEAAPAETPAKPAAANEAGTRWYLNAGSFGQKANAVALQDSLKQQGFAASVKEVAGEKGTVFKVRIGPMLDKAKAQAVKNKLTQINVNSFVSPEE